MSEIEIPAGVSPGVADIVRQFNAEDPAVRTWGESMAASTDQAASTSALLRRLTGELDQLREQYDAVLLERDALAAEVKRLTGRHARTYQLTDKGRAATETTEEQP